MTKNIFETDLYHPFIISYPLLLMPLKTTKFTTELPIPVRSMPTAHRKLVLLVRPCPPRALHRVNFKHFAGCFHIPEPQQGFAASISSPPAGIRSAKSTEGGHVVQVTLYTFKTK